jgi:hypothetical protein
MTTYRERREAKAERYRQWADKRETDAAAVFANHERYRGDIAFNTQPGHIPLRARVIAREERAFESLAKAKSMSSKAGTIESQLDESIYDDDPDAIERLEAKLAGLEARRTEIKARSAEMRKAGERMPAYVLQNLGGNITRTRQRLERLRHQAVRTEAAEQNGGVDIDDRRDGYTVVTFAEKPARDVLDSLKAAGFRWGKGSWVGRSDAVPAELRRGQA